MKDIVCEAAPYYVSQYQDIALIRARQDTSEGNVGGQNELDVAREKSRSNKDYGTDLQTSLDQDPSPNKAFSLARFVPLLAERIYVLSPFTRNYLVSWITVLDSVPDLELVSYLPQFLDGLLKYLSDPNTDVRVGTAKVLADFLREIQEAAENSRVHREQLENNKHSNGAVSHTIKRDEEEERVKDGAGQSTEAEGQQEDDANIQIPFPTTADEDTLADDAWIPTQEVRVDYAAIIEILLNHISYPDEEIQATTQQWIAELLNVVKEVVVPFTPRLIPAILPNIAHHSPEIQNTANVLNISLYHVIEELPWVGAEQAKSDGKADDKAGGSSAPGSPEKPRVSSPPTSPLLKATSTVQKAGTGSLGVNLLSINDTGLNQSSDPFDIQATVNVLTLQLIDEHEETRVSALQWLLMLHRQAPRRILSINDGTFPALLKTLSDPSEDVIRCDLRLLAQMSSASDDAYNSYLANLVNLFSTDRRLLETRGSLIIRQLCTTLHTERVFRTLAEILEKDEDLEFASIMITNLNMILITSPELADFRRRLKNLETRDGQNLFVCLYRSWCHNAVATLSLCLLAQAYEHASNLLTIFPDLEITVPFLIQIDKLVQLLESPVFMTLRLQLLEPDKHPHLLKTLYGVLMLLPQSSAFATLRNRLNAVSALGYLHIGSAARLGQGGVASTPNGATTGASSSMGGSLNAANVSATRSKIIGNNREDLKWNELLIHFKVVQGRHERARRAANAQPDPSSSAATTIDGHVYSTSALGISNESLAHTTGNNSARAGQSDPGKRRPGAAQVASAVRSKGNARSGRNEGGHPSRSSSTSFFRLPIGTGASSSSSAADNSKTVTPTISRPTSPNQTRRNAQQSSTTPVTNLISRTMSLSQQRPR